MVRIRLKRIGKKNAPFYRIVAIEKGKKVGGKELEVLGFWQPSKKLKELDREKLNAWVKKGALVSPTVKKLAE